MKQPKLKSLKGARVKELRDREMYMNLHVARFVARVMVDFLGRDVNEEDAVKTVVEEVHKGSIPRIERITYDGDIIGHLVISTTTDNGTVEFYPPETALPAYTKGGPDNV